MKFTGWLYRRWQKDDILGPSTQQKHKDSASAPIGDPLVISEQKTEKQKQKSPADGSEWGEQRQVTN